METKQKEIAQKLGISESYLSLIFSGEKPISRPLAEQLSVIFPKKDFKYWRKATPMKLLKAFNQLPEKETA
jgi:transcriptional regulator with XRE-family HTH domain